MDKIDEHSSSTGYHHGIVLGSKRPEIKYLSSPPALFSGKLEPRTASSAPLVVNVIELLCGNPRVDRAVSDLGYMPAFKDTLTARQMEAVLEYIKSHWSPQSRDFQWQMTVQSGVK